MQSRVTQDELKRVEEAHKRVLALEVRRLELERELLELRSGMSRSNSVSSLASNASSMSEQDILDDIMDTDERIRIERLMQGDTASITSELDRFKARLAELRSMGERLNSTGVDEVAQAKLAQAEMERLQSALNSEAEERHRLETEILALKSELQSALGGPRRAPITPGASGPAVLAAPKVRMTKYEMEMELLVLKKRLEAEKEERQRLAHLKGQIDGARTADGLLPDWIRQMEDVANHSLTLRVKIGRKQAENPDRLTFRERMLFFAAGAVDSNIKGPK